MEWFDGGIASGISEAKKRNTLFVVYIRDNSDDSKKMDQTWESSEVAEECKKFGLIVMRFLKDSDEYKMFLQFYPVLIIPSVSFISGDSGVLLEATAGHVDVPAFIERMKKAAKSLKSASKPLGGQPVPAQPLQSTTATQQATEPAGVSAQSQEKESVQERAARLRKRMEEVHAKKEAQKKEAAKNKEIERRKAGQAIQKVQASRSEQEARQLADEIKKERREDQLAKQKIREQIARDRAEKEARFAATKREDEKRRMERQEAAQEQRRTEDAATAAASKRKQGFLRRSKVTRKGEAESSRGGQKIGLTQLLLSAEISHSFSSVLYDSRETARIQFRLPDGSKLLHQFPSSATLGEAHQYVVEQVGDTLREFHMSTAFPRRQFGTGDMDTSLLDLQLAPSAAIVILPGSGGGRSSTAVSSGPGLISMIFAPLVFLWNLLYTFIFGTQSPPSEERGASGTSAPSQPQPQSYDNLGARPKSSYARRRTPASSGGGSVSKQEGNIHRLNRDDDNDEENNTWNGNSTQQM